MPGVAFFEAMLNIISVSSVAGALMAACGGAMGNRWCWLALIMHGITFLLIPSFGYA
jgi:hypothetical protein